jgi:hypothetical protein
MTDLVATDVTVVVNERYIQGRKKYTECTLTFGNGSLTYPTNGVPMPTYEKLGLKRNVQSMIVEEQNASGLVWEYDVSAHKLRALRSAALATHNHDLSLIASVTEDVGIGIETTAGPILGSSGAAITVAGADYATKGGVVPVSGSAVAALVEHSNVALAAQSLRVIVIGW